MSCNGAGMPPGPQISLCSGKLSLRPPTNTPTSPPEAPGFATEAFRLLTPLENGTRICRPSVRQDTEYRRMASQDKGLRRPAPRRSFEDDLGAIRWRLDQPQAKQGQETGVGSHSSRPQEGVGSCPPPVDPDSDNTYWPSLEVRLVPKPVA